MSAFGGMGKTQNRNKSRFSTSANLLIIFSTEYIQMCENEVTVLRSTEEDHIFRDMEHTSIKLAIL